MKHYDRNIEYKMSSTMAKDLLKTRQGEELKMNTQDYLCKVVNENFYLYGTCVRVLIH